MNNLYEFIEVNNRKEIDHGKLPINPNKDDISPVIPMNKWKTVDGHLLKEFEFRRDIDRDRFIIELLRYERQVQHRALIMIDNDLVSVDLYTRNVGYITELDKEYAKYCDLTFKDVVYGARGM